MHFRDLQPRLDPRAPAPMALQLAGLLAAEIQAGRLAPGEPLPGSRGLAEDLGVTRHVAMMALRELELEGWVESRPGSGTYVASRLPAARPRHWGPAAAPEGPPSLPAFALPSPWETLSSLRAGDLDLSEGLPDPRLSPKEALGRGYRRALERHGDRLLGPGEPRGNGSLREHLARHLLDHRGLRVGPDNLLVTRGTPPALGLLAAVLLPRGGRIAVEDPGQPPLWEALRAHPGVELAPVGVDAGGMDMASLEGVLARGRVDGVLVTPQRQWPTTVPLAQDRRERLLELARIHGFAILEVDPDLEFHGPEGPRLPLAGCDGEGRVIHLGSLARLLAPGLGVGYLAGPSVLVDRLAKARQRMGHQDDRVLEWALADLIRDGDLERHLARSRRVYQDRAAAFQDALVRILGPGFRARPPRGGLACWVETPPDLDLEAWAAACRRAGVRFLPGGRFRLGGGPLAAIPLGFGHLEPGEAQEALGRMALNLPGAARG